MLPGGLARADARDSTVAYPLPQKDYLLSAEDMANFSASMMDEDAHSPYNFSGNHERLPSNTGAVTNLTFFSSSSASPSPVRSKAAAGHSPAPAHEGARSARTRLSPMREAAASNARRQPATARVASPSLGPSPLSSRRGGGPTQTAPGGTRGGGTVVLKHTFNGVTRVLYDDGHVAEFSQQKERDKLAGNTSALQTSREKRKQSMASIYRGSATSSRGAGGSTRPATGDDPGAGSGGGDVSDPGASSSSATDKDGPLRVRVPHLSSESLGGDGGVPQSEGGARKPSASAVLRWNAAKADGSSAAAGTGAAAPVRKAGDKRRPQFHLSENADGDYDLNSNTNVLLGNANVGGTSNNNPLSDVFAATSPVKPTILSEPIIAANGGGNNNNSSRPLSGSGLDARPLSGSLQQHRRPGGGDLFITQLEGLTNMAASPVVGRDSLVSGSPEQRRRRAQNSTSDAMTSGLFFDGIHVVDYENSSAEGSDSEHGSDSVEDSGMHYTRRGPHRASVVVDNVDILDLRERQTEAARRVLKPHAQSMFSVPLPEFDMEGRMVRDFFFFDTGADAFGGAGSDAAGAASSAAAGGSGTPGSFRLPCGWTVCELYHRLLDRETGALRTAWSGLDIARFIDTSETAGEITLYYFWLVVLHARRAWIESLLIGRYHKLLSAFQELFPRVRKRTLPTLVNLELLVQELQMAAPEWRRIHDGLDLDDDDDDKDKDGGDEDKLGDSRATESSVSLNSRRVLRRMQSWSSRKNLREEKTKKQVTLEDYLIEGGYITILRLDEIMKTGTLPDDASIKGLTLALDRFVVVQQEYMTLCIMEEHCFRRLALLFGQLAHGRLDGVVRDSLFTCFNSIIVRVVYYTLLFCFPNDAHAGVFSAQFRADLVRLTQYWSSGLLVTNASVKGWPTPKPTDYAASRHAEMKRSEAQSFSLKRVISERHLSSKRVKGGGAEAPTTSPPLPLALALGSGVLSVDSSRPSSRASSFNSRDRGSASNRAKTTHSGSSAEESSRLCGRGARVPAVGADKTATAVAVAVTASPTGSQRGQQSHGNARTRPLDDNTFDDVDIEVINGEYRLISEYQKYADHASYLVQEANKRTRRQHRKQKRRNQISRRMVEQGGGGGGKKAGKAPRAPKIRFLGGGRHSASRASRGSLQTSVGTAPSSTITMASSVRPQREDSTTAPAEYGSVGGFQWEDDSSDAHSLASSEGLGASRSSRPGGGGGGGGVSGSSFSVAAAARSAMRARGGEVTTATGETEAQRLAREQQQLRVELERMRRRTNEEGMNFSKSLVELAEEQKREKMQLALLGKDESAVTAWAADSNNRKARAAAEAESERLRQLASGGEGGEKEGDERRTVSLLSSYPLVNADAEVITYLTDCAGLCYPGIPIPPMNEDCFACTELLVWQRAVHAAGSRRRRSHISARSLIGPGASRVGASATLGNASFGGETVASTFSATHSRLPSLEEFNHARKKFQLEQKIAHAAHTNKLSSRAGNQTRLPAISPFMQVYAYSTLRLDMSHTNDAKRSSSSATGAGGPGASLALRPLTQPPATQGGIGTLRFGSRVGMGMASAMASAAASATSPPAGAGKRETINWDGTSPDITGAGAGREPVKVSLAIPRKNGRESVVRVDATSAVASPASTVPGAGAGARRQPSASAAAVAAMASPQRRSRVALEAPAADGGGVVRGTVGRMQRRQARITVVPPESSTRRPPLLTEVRAEAVRRRDLVMDDVRLLAQRDAVSRHQYGRFHLQAVAEIHEIESDAMLARLKREARRALELEWQQRDQPPAPAGSERDSSNVLSLSGGSAPPVRPPTKPPAKMRQMPFTM